MADACPCCGGALPTTPVRWSKETRTVLRNGKAVQLPQREADVFDVIWRARPEKLSRMAIVERVWAYDENGGPETSNIVSVHLSHINKKLEPVGVRVGRPKGAGPGIGVAVL